MKIDLAGHYGFSSLPSSHVSLDEGCDFTSPLIIIQHLNSKIGEGGPVTPGASPVPFSAYGCVLGDVHDSDSIDQGCVAKTWHYMQLYIRMKGDSNYQ